MTNYKQVLPEIHNQFIFTHKFNIVANGKSIDQFIAILDNNLSFDQPIDAN